MDAEIARQAARQQWVVTRAQLLAAGLSPAIIDRRLRDGRLHRVFRGVYAVGRPELSARALAQAALLACPGSVLSHRSAGAAWRFLPHPPPRPEITTTSRSGPGHPGIALHRVRSLPPAHVTRRDGLPLTVPERTLLDLAETLPRDELTRALNEAGYLRVVTRSRLLALTKECRGRHGIAALRAILDDAADGWTRSQLEDRFLALVRDAGLPLPQTNARVDRYRVDFLWPRERVVVETDGWAAHGTRAAFERDRARDARLQALGHRVMRVTPAQLRREPLRVLATLAALLA